MLKKIECYLVPSKLEKIRDYLVSEGIEGMSILEARGFGTRSKVSSGKPQLEDRAKIEIVVDEAVVDEVIRGIKDMASAGSIGAGMIFVTPVEDAVRLSTREHGRAAIL